MAHDNNNKPIRIGLFDSGVGGLSVFRRLHELATVCAAPDFEFVYLGDTARCPYGNRDTAELQQFILQIIGFLALQGVDHLIMACNTSAAVGVDYAHKVSPVPVHDLISPTARFAAANFRKVGIMATQSTVSSGAFTRNIQYHAPDCQVIEIACPKLVPLVEAGDLESDRARSALFEYTSRLEELEVEAIILGCTHFPFLSQAISELLPSSIAVIDPADVLVQQLIFHLGVTVPAGKLEHALLARECLHNSLFFTTGSAGAFAQAASVCLGKTNSQLVPLERVRSLNLETLGRISLPGNDIWAPDLLPGLMPLLPSGTSDTKIAAP